MAFDQSTRNRLARFVGEARALLTEEFTRQLQHDYGMDPSQGEVTSLERLAHLDDARHETARILRATLTHYLAGESKPSARTRKQALERIVREQAFTVLNRLCALRLAEARDLIIEAVGQGYQSRGFQLYARLAGTALGETGDAYRAYLFSLFDEFALDLAVLFDRFSPQGRLFPRDAVLAQLLDLINHPDLEPLWAEDETIGWIYQYFNSQEERRQMRAESQAPRNSRELAVRNQFFTPRYVVEFLTDNTLGRIWYEMTRGATRLVEQCRYLVRRPKEIFLGALDFGDDYFAEWVQAVAQGDFQAMPERPALDEIGQVALLIDGYELQDVHAEKDVLKFGSRHMAAFVEQGTHFPNDTLAIWLTLFAYQRGMLRHGMRDDPTNPYVRGIRAAYDALRHALQNPPEDLSQEELLNQPVYIPHRPHKDPRELRLLDPACGSMHFGLYAFDLFEIIYEEAWERGWIPQEDFVRLILQKDPISNYTNQPVPFDDAYVVITRRGDFGDGVEADLPYIVASSERFRVPFDYRVKLTEFDYQQALSAGVFSLNAGERMMRDTGCFEYDFRRQIPRLIIEHNLHGIDIDPRAVQIAGLSLWLRAQRSWQAQGLKPHERPVIRKSNIVCAEPMPGDPDQLTEFLKGLREERLESLIRRVLDVPEHQRVRATPTMADALCELVSTVWHEMELAGEAGSLLKIEESLAAAIDHARNEWEQRLPLFRVETFRMTEGGTAESLVRPKVNYLKTVPGEEADFWDRAEALVLAALEEYAQQAENGGGYARRLFATDAARGFAFIDLCRKRYDVVLMNPPFGNPSVSSRQYLRNEYPSLWADIYAAFIVSATKRITDMGLIGAITSRSFLALPSFENLRALMIDFTPVQVVIECGLGVLDDATVRVCLFVVAKMKHDASASMFVDLRGSNNRESDLLAIVKGDSNNSHGPFLVPVSEFRRLPSQPFVYWLPDPLRRLLINGPHLDPKRFSEDSKMGIAHVAVGISTTDDMRFVRAHWEIPRDVIGTKYWARFAHAVGFARFYSPTFAVMNWREEGRELLAITDDSGNVRPRLRYREYLFEKGLVSPYISERGLGCSFLPDDQIVSNSCRAYFEFGLAPEMLVAYLNSQLADLFIWALTPDRKHEASIIAAIPIPREIAQRSKRLTELSLTCWSSMLSLRTMDETDPLHLVNFRNWGQRIDKHQARYLNAQQEIDQICCLRDISSTEIAELLISVNAPHDLGQWIPSQEGVPDIRSGSSESERFSSLISHSVGATYGIWNIGFSLNIICGRLSIYPFDPLPPSPPGMLQNADGLPATPADVPADYPLRISWPGILVDDPGHAEDIVGRVREALAVIWPATHDAIEQEACEILGVDDLRAYFANANKFFADHLKRYSKSRRSAPIYWPLSTQSGSYTLWLYYHRLSDQMLYTCVNDFVDPKLAECRRGIDALHGRQRSTDQERELERLTELEAELQEFRAELLRIARFWRPNLNDGVQITAAPLWRLFRHRAWQKRLQETWEKLEQGDYDWAHLAMSIWPERVVPKCLDDRSLAIAHDVEDLFWVEEDGKWRKLQALEAEIARQKARAQALLNAKTLARAQQALADLAAGPARGVAAAQVAQHLAEGDWDDTHVQRESLRFDEVALLFWPERVAQACLDDPFLADKLRLNLPAKRTQAARKRFVKQLNDAGCPHLAQALLDTLAPSGDEEDAALETILADLHAGKRDAAPLALAFRPEEVIDRALDDEDLAAAHDLRRFFWVQTPDGGWRRRVDPKQEVVDEVRRRQ